MDWTSFLAILATVTSFACQFVGLELCFRIIKKGNAYEIAPAPFVTFFVSACIWLKYGLMMNITNVILTSCLSAVLQFLYLCIYYVYTTKKYYVHRLVFLGIAVLLPPLVYVDYMEGRADLATRNLGLYGSGLSVLCYASPLATLSEVLRQKSTETISFPLCAMNFLCAVEWTLYGEAIHDNFIVLPNLFGIFLGLLQFVLFCIYGFKRKPRTIMTIDT